MHCSCFQELLTATTYPFYKPLHWAWLYLVLFASLENELFDQIRKCLIARSMNKLVQRLPLWRLGALILSGHTRSFRWGLRERWPLAANYWIARNNSTDLPRPHQSGLSPNPGHQEDHSRLHNSIVTLWLWFECPIFWRFYFIPDQWF